MKNSNVKNEVQLNHQTPCLRKD